MRWSDSKKEVTLFGVNYTTPFAHAFRAHDYIGVEHKKAIDADVYHFARMGLDAYRCHIWDSEICDSIGNIISTRQLDLFDYLLYSLKQRGIKSILTPLKFGSNGYPEPNTPTPGFSDIYGKNGCLNNPDTWPYQERYLAGFLEHVNPYTGISYKDDPDIIAIEINNEPGHENAELTRRYLETMIGSIRSTGFRKPVFYNLSHNFHITEVFLDADIQGGTFQWYPSGLVANREQPGNFLPNIDTYPVSFSDHNKFRNKARMIYEFDPADIGRSYTYPAMARSFRESGFQFATQFAYDPMYIAYANTEYQTHYMNIAYAPQKGLSLMIASEVFHQLPLYYEAEDYPGNNHFGNFRVSYEKDLAELISENKFIYSNNTSGVPPDNKKLVQIAGFGNSPVISYEGTGAYFLDRLEEGIWRLEVMPDAIWVRDPFERASLKKEVSVIRWNEWPMSVFLEDLGEGFEITGINNGNHYRSVATGAGFTVGPGIYLLTRNSIRNHYNGNEKWKNITLNEFVAPGDNRERDYLLHAPMKEISEGLSYRVSITNLSKQKPRSVKLYAIPPGSRPVIIEMDHEGGYSYSCEIKAEYIKKGYLEYLITVESDGRKITWPAGVEGAPFDWDFYAWDTWQTRIVERSAPISLFNAHKDSDLLTLPQRFARYNLIPSNEPGRSLVEIKTRDLLNPEHDFSFKYCFRKNIAGRDDDLREKKQLVLSGYSLDEKPLHIEIALVLTDGSTYGGLIGLTPYPQDHILLLDDLKPVRLVLLPRAYPAMMPYWFRHPVPSPFDISEIESVQISIGPGIPEQEYANPHGFALERIWLE